MMDIAIISVGIIMIAVTELMLKLAKMQPQVFRKKNSKLISAMSKAEMILIILIVIYIIFIIMRKIF